MFSSEENESDSQHGLREGLNRKVKNVDRHSHVHHVSSGERADRSTVLQFTYGYNEAILCGPSVLVLESVLLA